MYARKSDHEVAPYYAVARRKATSEFAAKRLQPIIQTLYERKGGGSFAANVSNAVSDIM